MALSQLDVTTEWREAAALVAAAGFHGEPAFEPLAGGANNRVFRARADSGAALLKAYFTHPDDGRDRLGAEFGFASFAWRAGIRRLPRPLARDDEHRLALYEWIEGRSAGVQDVTAAAVGAALDFFYVLNREKRSPEAARLPVASEASFSVAAHLGGIERRVRQLAEIDTRSPAGRAAATFVRDVLAPTWTCVATSVRDAARRRGVDVEKPIEAEARCLSPSDFGFHNVIVSADGSLAFIDFEYAGWDDPAKLTSDFFCQPAVPVPLEHFGAFVDAIVSTLPDPETARWRCRLLLSVYQVKWCCILMNEFIPAGRARRRFARGAVDDEADRAAQLGKARAALARLSAVRDAVGSR